MKFQYLTDLNSKTTTGKHKKRPVVEVVLSRNGKRREFLAVIDSGADVTMMSTQIADMFEIDWKQLPTSRTLGISGTTQVSYLGSMDVAVKKIGEALTLPVLFTEANIPILLGQEGFFDAYRIKFEKDHDTFEITKSNRA
jgi:hypothetical protein